MRTIALANQKGGVGKTTTAVNLASGLARLGRRVLLIDLDPQANATVSFGLLPHTLQKTSYALLMGKLGPEEAMIDVEPGLRLIPSNLDLAGAELELSTMIGRDQVLRDQMGATRDFDFVILDLPPSLGLISLNGFTYVREVVVPLQCEFLALHGISLLVRTLGLVRKRLNPDLHVGGVVACMYDARRALSRETFDHIVQHFGERVYKTKIRSNVRLAEAPSHGKSIFAYAPDSHGAEDYMSLAREVGGVPDATSAVPAAAVETPALPS